MIRNQDFSEKGRNFAVSTFCQARKNVDNISKASVCHPGGGTHANFSNLILTKSYLDNTSKMSTKISSIR